MQSRLATLEFDLQKQRSETMSYMRQLAMKEQEIFQLQQEISDLENALDKFKHQNEESQVLMDRSS